MITEIQSVTDYLKIYGNQLAGKVKQGAEPLFTPGDAWDPKMDTLLRKPFTAQGDVIQSLTITFQEKNAAIVVGEMGSGKSLIGACVPYLSRNGGRPPRVLILCPGHLVKKWQREIRETVPHAQARIIRRLTDVLAIDPSRTNRVPEYYIISKDRAKLGYAWRPAAIFSKVKGGFVCPGCGRLIVNSDGVPVGIGYFKRKKRSCHSCGCPLWQADNARVRRYAVSEYIKKHMKGFYDFFIADEVHEYKGGTTAQGNSFGALASASRKTIALTGTLLGGYADDIFYILYRLSPKTMKQEGLEYNRISEWMSRYGVLEKITKYSSEDNTWSRGKKTSTILKRKPGISPMVFSNHLLGKSAFLHLADIALKLPAISEQVVCVEMEPELEEAYRALEGVLLKAVREALVHGSKRLLGAYLNNLLSYPDKPFNNQPIIDPATRHLPKEEQRIIAIPPELSRDTTYSKEQQLVEIVRKEVRNGRKCFVFATYTGTKDVTLRLKEILEKEGLKAEILRSQVKPELREEWVNSKVKQGVEVIISNPKLVETGLDLLDFPTLIFHQTGYSVYTLRQASRRSWRIGQDRDVKLYYLFYRNTLQEKALQLMGSKMEASLAIEGKFSEEGLLAMTQGEDMSTALAKALVDGLDVEGAEDIWRKINEKNAEMTGKIVTEDIASEPIDEKEREETKEQRPEPEPLPKDPNKVVYVDFMTFVGSKRKKRKVKKMAMTQAELDEMISEEGEQAQAQFSLF
jgi:superfamily II DNA or RNA helicase